MKAKSEKTYTHTQYIKNADYWFEQGKKDVAEQIYRKWLNSNNQFVLHDLGDWIEGEFNFRKRRS